MRYFPINLDMCGRPAVVVGGGAVALRKCYALLEAGARVTVIAPEIDGGLKELLQQGRLAHLAREYAPGDLKGAFLAFAATDSAAVNEMVASEAKERGVLADIADAPALGAFTLPAVMRQGELLVTVSTGGKSPALARRLREQLEALYGPEYAATLDLLGALREKLLTDKRNSTYNNKLLNALVDHDLPALFKKQATAEIDHLLTSLLGPEFTLTRLGVGEKDPE